MGLIVLAAVLTELVVILAADNQGVTDWVQRHLAGHQSSLADQLALAGQSYQWRVMRDGFDTTALGAQYALIGVTLLLTGLLVLAVCRGPVSFARAFFGTWMAVVFATLVGSLVRAAILSSNDRFRFGSGSRGIFIVLSTYSSNAYLVAAALGLGLLTAIVAAVVAVTTRRVVAVAPGLGEPHLGAESGPDGEWTPFPDPPPPPPWNPPPPEPPRWNPPAAAEPPAWTPAPAFREPAAAPSRWPAETAETVETPQVAERADMTRHEADRRDTTALPRVPDEPQSDPHATREIRIDEDDLRPPL